ncbi:glycosyltransferase family 4 protein [Mesobacillus jeotgali]|uniref:glycosyltransferase family 4 protein n=1 Tax=Mesobacillus jeotgali TaxID=129985 RepID=UPI0017876B0E|nr:glycosyltransferase family 4 protein [Mesobacillus jeotgali]UYZ21800.1 glycosyltransferase family 4 protein [Mesobacillus jeotgali]
MINKNRGIKKEKLLIYAHYYTPDVASTGQLLKELAEGMIQELDVTVICVVPSYSGRISPEYKTKFFYREELNGVKIIRIRVPEFSKSSKSSRVLNILAYFLGAIFATLKVGKINYVYSISQPPILGGLLGIFGKWSKNARYIYNIQDFNPEQIMAVGYSKNKVILKLMLWLDKLSCKSADKVIVVGRDMIETLKKRFKGKKLPNHVFINNWINEKEIYPVADDAKEVIEFREQYGLVDKFIIMYSGNLGLYYDLENLLNIIKEFPDGTKVADGRELVFAFVGDGSLKNSLIDYKQRNKMDNVVFIPYQKKKDLVYSLNAGNVHLCVSAKGIRGVSVPSKLYGIMASGRPVLGVLEKGSEARLIIEETGCGLVCDPGDYKMIKKVIEQILNLTDSNELGNMGRLGRKYLTENLTKDVSVSKYIKEIKTY